MCTAVHSKGRACVEDTPSRRSTLREDYSMLDVDGDGTVTVEEGMQVRGEEGEGVREGS